MTDPIVYVVIDQLDDYPRTLGAYLDEREAQATRERTEHPRWVEVERWRGGEYLGDLERDPPVVLPPSMTVETVDVDGDGTSLRMTWEQPMTREDVERFGRQLVEGFARGIEVELAQQRLAAIANATPAEWLEVQHAPVEGVLGDWRDGNATLSLGLDDATSAFLWAHLAPQVPDRLKPAREALVAQGWTAPAWGYRNGQLAPIERMTP